MTILRQSAQEKEKRKKQSEHEPTKKNIEHRKSFEKRIIIRCQIKFEHHQKDLVNAEKVKTNKEHESAYCTDRPRCDTFCPHVPKLIFVRLFLQTIIQRFVHPLHSHQKSWRNLIVIPYRTEIIQSHPDNGVFTLHSTRMVSNVRNVFLAAVMILYFCEPKTWSQRFGIVSDPTMYWRRWSTKAHPPLLCSSGMRLRPVVVADVCGEAKSRHGTVKQIQIDRHRGCSSCWCDGQKCHTTIPCWVRNSWSARKCSSWMDRDLEGCNAFQHRMQERGGWLALPWLFSCFLQHQSFHWLRPAARYGGEERFVFYSRLVMLTVP